MNPVAAKLHRQPNFSNSNPRIGTPIAVENFAAASVIAVARLRSPFVNQYPIAFAFAGNVGASPRPNRSLAPKNPVIPLEIAAPNEAALQSSVLTNPTRRTPKRSSKTPDGICMAA